MDFALTWLDEEWYHDTIRQRVDPSHVRQCLLEFIVVIY